MAGKQVVDFVLIETSLSRLKIGEVKDPTSLEEVTSVPKDKQQTEEQSGEDESESFEETLGENQGNLTSFNITIKFERRQYQIFFFFKKTNRKTSLICKAMDSYPTWEGAEAKKIFMCRTKNLNYQQDRVLSVFASSPQYRISIHSKQNICKWK